jgi:hypothetical protein
VGRLKDLFAGNSVSAFAERARRAMAAGRLDEARRIVLKGQERHAHSAALVELSISLRRAEAHAAIRHLEQNIAARGDARAYEELIRIYRELDLPADARRHALAYVERHPELDTPHLILGSMYLDMFFDELRARHGHLARESLLLAASLNAMALQPRLLLAELYYCIGASRSLAIMMRALEQMSPDHDALEPAYAVMDAGAEEAPEDSFDGLFERIENQGTLARAPETWPLCKRRSRTTETQVGDTDAAVSALMDAEVTDELVLLRRDNSLVTHATPSGLHDTPHEHGGGEPGNGGLVDVVRIVATKVFPQAREFDMGRFNRCTVQGSLGNVVIGPVGHLLAGARCRTSVEPLRMWERVRMTIEDASGGDGS